MQIYYSASVCFARNTWFADSTSLRDQIKEVSKHYIRLSPLLLKTETLSLPLLQSLILQYQGAQAPSSSTFSLITLYASLQ